MNNHEKVQWIIIFDDKKDSVNLNETKFRQMKFLK